jgi:hypothetical protein
MDFKRVRIGGELELAHGDRLIRSGNIEYAETRRAGNEQEVPPQSDIPGPAFPRDAGDQCGGAGIGDVDDLEAGRAEQVSRDAGMVGRQLDAVGPCRDHGFQMPDDRWRQRIRDIKDIEVAAQEVGYTGARSLERNTEGLVGRARGVAPAAAAMSPTNAMATRRMTAGR